MRARHLLHVLPLLFGCAHGHKFDDPERWAKDWDDPSRDSWQKPDQVLNALALKPDDVVADVGAGTGYFTVRLARSVPSGKVFACDIEPKMVAYLGERAAKVGLHNVVPVLSQQSDPLIPEPVDVVLVVDTYHHLEEREAYFRQLLSRLKPDGRLAIIDFTKSSPFGPNPKERLTVDEVNSELTVAGYKLQASYDFLPNQFFLIFSPAHFENSVKARRGSL